MKAILSLLSSGKSWFLYACIVAGLCPWSVGAAEYKGTGGYDAPYFQADYYQDLSEWSSALVNPALLYRVNQFHFDIGIYRWAQGGWGFQQVAFQAPIRRNHTAGLTIINAGVAITRMELQRDLS
ncbi:MAG: hypothetical protein GF350_10165, partial [Chitinivibrionales bacterium]|nr:hypothetical protein [Chitinivibrionales bacterium]